MVYADRARMAGACMVFCLLASTVQAEKATSAQTVGTHAGGIASIHYSPDGKWIASGGGDKMIRLWNVASNKMEREWKGPSSFTCAVRFSPDSKILAAAGYETGPGNAIYLYEVATGKELPQLPGHPTGGVRRLMFTPDGKRLLSGGFDGIVREWDLATSQELRQIKVESGTVYSLAVSPDGKMMTTAGRDGLKVWNLATGVEIPREGMSKHNCVAVAWSPDGKLIASGDSTTVRIWEFASGKEVNRFKGYTGELSQLVFSGDGRTLYTSSYDKQIRLWEVRSGRLIHQAEGHTGWIWGIALSPDEKTLVSCSVDTKLLRWDLSEFGRPVGKTSRLTSKDLSKHVAELSSQDAGAAYRAICALASDPSSSLPVLEQRLSASRPIGPTPAQLAQWVHDLDSDQYRVREDAYEALAHAGVCALPILQQVMKAPPSLEVRKRVTRLLARLDPLELPPDELAAIRTVQTLEYMGTTEARSVLERVSRTGQRLGDEAGQALLRLTRER